MSQTHRFVLVYQQQKCIMLTVWVEWCVCVFNWKQKW